MSSTDLFESETRRRGAEYREALERGYRIMFGITCGALFIGFLLGWLARIIAMA